MSDDANDQTTTSPEAEGSTTPPTPEQKGTAGDDPVALARRRQAGAESARQEAERKLAEATAELATLRSKNQTAEQAELTELARLKAQLEAETKRANEAETVANAKLLDLRFPNARKELPEVTDEVRLAKFEALLREDVDAEEPATPRGSSPDKTRQRQPAKPQTRDEIIEEMRKMPLPWAN